MIRRTLIVGALALLAACAAATPESNSASAPAPARVYPLIGQAAPAFSAPLVSGGTLNNAALAGKWTVIEFWGLWCEDSVADLSHSRALASAIAQDPSLRFVTIHVDERYGPYVSPAEYVQKEQVTYPIALDPDQAIKRAFQVQSTPTYLIVDPAGIIRASRGELRKETNPDGGVKTLIKQIAELKRAAP